VVVPESATGPYHYGPEAFLQNWGVYCHIARLVL
jgi:hypothetical protein